MLNLKIIPNINNSSDYYIFFCEKNFSFNPKKLPFIDINNKEIYSILEKNKDEDYFVFNYHSTRPKKIIFINQKDNKDDFENQNIGGKIISEVKLFFPLGWGDGINPHLKCSQNASNRAVSVSKRE